MATILSYLAILVGVSVFSVVVYFGLLKIKLI
uniref:Cytochrome b6-f complex subunit 6 n=1 Tax=Scotinosphaera sp. NIES-154 TaxID=2249731 RepID=A0A2Z4MAI0_9CHLO|nr:PetL [Scotinosphaera sp. NIES-154]